MTSLQAVNVLLRIVDALDNHYFRDIEGIGDTEMNEARQAIAVLMNEHASPITAEEVIFNVDGEALRTANGAGGSEQTNAGGKEK